MPMDRVALSKCDVAVRLPSLPGPETFFKSRWQIVNDITSHGHSPADNMNKLMETIGETAVLTIGKRHLLL